MVVVEWVNTTLSAKRHDAFASRRAPPDRPTQINRRCYHPAPLIIILDSAFSIHLLINALVLFIACIASSNTVRPFVDYPPVSKYSCDTKSNRPNTFFFQWTAEKNILMH
jgi:hypothetical protein